MGEAAVPEEVRGAHFLLKFIIITASEVALFIAGKGGNSSADRKFAHRLRTFGHSLEGWSAVFVSLEAPILGLERELFLSRR